MPDVPASGTRVRVRVQLGRAGTLLASFPTPPIGRSLSLSLFPRLAIKRHFLRTHAVPFPLGIRIRGSGITVLLARGFVLRNHIAKPREKENGMYGVRRGAENRDGKRPLIAGEWKRYGM